MRGTAVTFWRFSRLAGGFTAVPAFCRASAVTRDVLKEHSAASSSPSSCALLLGRTRSLLNDRCVPSGRRDFHVAAALATRISEQASKQARRLATGWYVWLVAYVWFDDFSPFG